MNVKCEYEDIVSLRRVFTEPPPLSQREGTESPFDMRHVQLILHGGTAGAQ